jgi:nucleoside-diphosphate-sugar epimerase
MSGRVLFLGGAGMIGAAVAAEAERSGIELTIVTRGEPTRPIPDAVRRLRADVRDTAALRAILAGERFDAVVNWVGFQPGHVADHPELFAELTDQYVFISTCSVYARPVPQLPVTESSPVAQPRFAYGREKIECEELLTAAFRRDGFPLTIVRPFHTYDETALPFPIGWTTIARMREGKPVVVHGDGTSLWTLMHTSDFARAFVPLLGNRHAIGETVNVVSGDILSWDQIHLAMAAAAGVRTPQLVHRSSESIAAEWPGWGEVLQEDFRHSMVFDTSKLRRLVPGFAPSVPFSEGARRIMAYHDADTSRQEFSAELDAAFDRLIARP